ncbi:hypothetical protein M422DRAFT_250496 [Sphaerobolus stellatus SS14]|uniref:Uncharacterized protein n=1 Tax=Sphaerobolus stellatus (strain SS14) TaxID=990650 RepID=A0A0C9VTX2_SPHS4|nr:hypothetical protein M422DRAFT_250496 [Sphaerobolus stellatus SS14]
MDSKRKRSIEVITPGPPPLRPPPSLRNSTRLQQLDQYNIRSGAINLDELAAIILDAIECFGFVIVGLNGLPGELRSAGARLLDAATTGLKAIDTLLHGLRFARKFHRKLDHLSQRGQLSTILRDLTDGEWEKLGLLASKAHSCILDCLSVMRECQAKFLSVSEVPRLDDFVLIMEISESQKYTVSSSDIMTTFKLSEPENPLFRLWSFLEVENSKMIWPPSESTISTRGGEWPNLEQLGFFFKDKMALVPTRYRSYIPSLPNYAPDHPVLRSPAFLPFRVGGIDDRDFLYQEASGSQGFKRFISPLLEFDWNEPLDILPDILRWIAPFLKSTQQENPPDTSEIGLLAEMYLKGIILLVESLYMGNLFFDNYATNAAWYFERPKARGKYALVLGEDEIGPWKIAMALSKYSFDSFAIAQDHADALRIQFDKNYNWIQIPTFTSKEYPCYLSVRKILETLSSGRSFEKLRSLVYNWNQIWDASKFPGSVPDNIHLEAVDEETLKLWYEGGSSYTACELLYQQLTVDAKTRLRLNIHYWQPKLWNNVSNWISKTITYNHIQLNPPFTYPIWPDAFLDDFHLIPEGLRTQITYELPPIVVVPPHPEQFLTDTELARLQIFHQYISRKDGIPINNICSSVTAINDYYSLNTNISRYSFFLPDDYETAVDIGMPFSTGLSLQELGIDINRVLFDLKQSVLKAFKFHAQFYTLFGTPSPSGPRVLVEPKLQLFNTLDIATRILDPLAEYQDKFKNIYVTLDHLDHVSLNSSRSGTSSHSQISSLVPKQLVKLIGGLEQGIREWYRWWIWTTEHSPEGSSLECLSINGILWPGSLQTNWHSMQSLVIGFESLSTFQYRNFGLCKPKDSLIRLASATLQKPYRCIDEPPGRQVDYADSSDVLKNYFTPLIARTYKYKNARQWGHRENDADSSSSQEDSLPKATLDLLSPSESLVTAQRGSTSGSKGSVKRFIGKFFKEAKPIQAGPG